MLNACCLLVMHLSARHLTRHSMYSLFPGHVTHMITDPQLSACYSVQRRLCYLQVMQHICYPQIIEHAYYLQFYSRQLSLRVMQHTCYSRSCNGHIACWWCNAHVIHTKCIKHILSADCRTFNVQYVLNCMSIHHTCYWKVKLTHIPCNAHVFRKVFNTHIVLHYSGHVRTQEHVICTCNANTSSANHI